MVAFLFFVGLLGFFFALFYGGKVGVFKGFVGF